MQKPGSDNSPTTGRGTPPPRVDPARANPALREDRPDRPANMPSEIDGYKLLHVVGSGGMATVYAALQERPRRTVALKVMKSGIDDEVAIRRFRREIEILGKLRHQYIAQVFSAGTWNDGRHALPYFTMEYIPEARTIFQYAAFEDLSVRERVKLFVLVCAAIDHGHSHRIVHRDLKPSNILVDRRGRPKVIDFGVARVSELQVGLDTMTTEMGRLVGTIQYMSPEQVAAEVTDLDARSDVYGLGVLLYKLLTGRHPHELEGLPVYEAVRAIREDMPPRPSSIRPELRGDLDTIVLKALEKDPTRRFRTAGEFGRDLVRWLESKPIHARPAGSLYRMRLFMARHKAAVLSTVVSVAVILASAGVVLFVLYGESARQRQFQAQLDELMAERTTTQQQMRDVMDANEAAERDRQSQRDVVLPPQPLPPPTFIDAPDPVTAITWFMQNQQPTMITATAASTAIIWDMERREPRLTIDEHDSPLVHVAAGGSMIVTASADAGIALDDINTGDFLGRISTQCAAAPDAMALNDQATMLAWSCPDMAVRLVDLPSRQQTGQLRSSRGPIVAVCFNASGTRVAGGTERGSVFVWDVQSGREVWRMDDLNERIIGVTFNAGSDALVAATEQGDVACWRLSEAPDEQPTLLARATAQREGAKCFSASADRSYIALSSGPALMRLDIRALHADSFTGRELDDVTMIHAEIAALALNHNGSMIAAADSNGRVVIHHRHTAR